MMSDSRTAGQLKPLKKQNQSDQVVEILQEYIASDKIEVGDKLPPELSLAEMLNVSRSTVREAIRTLSVLGYIEIVNGKGSFLRQKSIDLTMKQIVGWFESHRTELNDFIEVRRLIEPYAVSVAIKRGSDLEISTVDAIRLKYEAELSTSSGKVLGNLDAEFHQAIVEMAHNPVLSNMYRVVVEAFSGLQKRSFSVQMHADNAVAPHREIMKAIKDRDTEKARTAIIEHLNKVYTDMSFSKDHR